MIWPQASRVVIPPLGNSVNGLLDDVAGQRHQHGGVAARTQILVQERFAVLELFTIAALYFLAMTSAWALVQARIERRYGRAYAHVPGEQR